MIRTRSASVSGLLQKKVDRHKNMLILGEGATTYAMNKVMYHDSAEAVEKLYGASELSRAFSLAKQLGAQGIFVLNVRRKADYAEAAEALRHHDFAYIVPLGAYFSESFYSTRHGRQMTYAEFFLDSIGPNNHSLLIMTDAHASLFEDMDSYLHHMISGIRAFKKSARNLMGFGRNLCLVANNLKETRHANLALAAALCTAEPGSYPATTFGTTVFDLDELDVAGQELAYHKNSITAGVSIDNLQNFRQEKDAAKYVAIDMVIKYIERELDFSEYRGKTYSQYAKVQIEKKLGDFLRSITGKAIRGYRVNSVEFVATAPGVGTVVNHMTIMPVNSVEEFNLIMEV